MLLADSAKVLRLCATSEEPQHQADKEASLQAPDPPLCPISLQRWGRVRPEKRRSPRSQRAAPSYQPEETRLTRAPAKEFLYFAYQIDTGESCHSCNS